MTVEVTGIAQRDAWLDRRLPPVEEVRQGIWSIPLPNAQSGIRYVLCYVFELEDGLGVVDPGWNDADSWEALVGGLDRMGRTVSDIRSVVITHSHPDHLGGAHRLRETAGAPVLIHKAELALIAPRRGDPSELIARTAPWLTQHGSTDAEIASFYSDRTELESFSDMTQPDGFLTDAQRLPWAGREVYAVHTPGHTPGHLCLHLPEERVLLTGDHLLPRITPTVSAFPRSGPNPLERYLSSLEKIAGFDVDEVLPGHEYRFSGLADRVEAVLQHHEVREAELASLLAAMGSPVTAAQTSERLTWSRPWGEILPPMRRAALAETVAHFVLLESRGVVVRDDSSGSTRWALPT